MMVKILIVGTGLLLLPACVNNKSESHLFLGYDTSKIDPSLVSKVQQEMKKYPKDVVELPLTKVCLKTQTDLLTQNVAIDKISAKFASLPTCSCTTFSLKNEPQYEEINRKAMAEMDYLTILEAHEEVIPKVKHCGEGVKFEDVCTRDLLSSLPEKNKDASLEGKLKANCICAMEAFLKMDQSLALDFMIQTVKENSFLKTLGNPQFQAKYMEASESCKK